MPWRTVSWAGGEPIPPPKRGAARGALRTRRARRFTRGVPGRLGLAAQERRVPRGRDGTGARSSARGARAARHRWPRRGNERRPPRVRPSRGRRRLRPACQARGAGARALRCLSRPSRCSTRWIGQARARRAQARRDAPRQAGLGANTSAHRSRARRSAAIGGPERPGREHCGAMDNTQRRCSHVGGRGHVCISPFPGDEPGTRSRR